MVTADEQAVCIDEIVSFYQKLNISPQNIRDSIAHLSWENQMKRVVDAVYPPKVVSNKIRLAYCIPSLNHSGGMERALTTKANYLADKLNYDVNIIITDGNGTKPYFQLSNKINIIQLNVNIDSLWQYPIWKRLYLYNIKMKDYKRKLGLCLNMLKPDITISLLRREINFLSDLKDGSAKIGEIHFGRYKYREANFMFLPTIANRWISVLWMRQLEQKIKKLDRFVVLTHEDATYWKGLTNLMVIPNPITIQNTEQSDCRQKRAIAVGRYTYQKGYDMLIKAWKEVNQKHPDWQLDIYGGGDREKYRKQVISLPILCKRMSSILHL